MTQRLGIAYIKIDGALLESMPGASIDLGGVMRTPVIGGNAVLGHSETPKEAVVECQIAVGRGTSLAQLQKITAATITFEADTGQTWIVREAVLAEPPKATAGDGGQVPLKFFGPPAEEMGV